MDFKEFWKMCIMWIISVGARKPGKGKKQISTLFIHMKNVDIVDNYCFKRFSPIFTTSPAPIVINRSPGVQFSKINF